MGAAACDLAAHELRRHERRKGCTEALPVGETRFRLIGLTLPPDILAVGDIDHLLGDDPGAGELELGDELLNLPLVAVYPLPLEGRSTTRSQERVVGRGYTAVICIRPASCPSLKGEGTLEAPPITPRPRAAIQPARRREPVIDVDAGFSVGVGARRVVDAEGGPVRQRDLAERHDIVVGLAARNRPCGSRSAARC